MNFNFSDFITATVCALISAAVSFGVAKYEAARKLRELEAQWAHEQEQRKLEGFNSMLAAVARLFSSPVAEDRRRALSAIGEVRASADGKLYDLLSELFDAANSTDTKRLRSALDSVTKYQSVHAHDNDPK